MVGMISMRKEFNETYGGHIRADYARIVNGERVWRDDHIWSGYEVDAMMAMLNTYGNSENIRLETYAGQDLRIEGE